MFHLNHTLATLRISTSKGKMIRISRNVHGADSPFKQESTQYHHARTRPRKNIIKCNVQAGTMQKQNDSMRNNNNNSSTLMQQRPMVQNKLRFSQAKSSINNNNHNRTSPIAIKELQPNASKHHHHHQVHASDSSDHSDNEINLFAGSKSYVTPSPSELPKPPANWMMNLCALESKTKSPDNPLDVVHDSAILVVGTKTDKSLRPLLAQIK